MSGPISLPDITNVGELIQKKRAADRAQVDQLAAWLPKPTFEPLKRTFGQPIWVDIRACLQNGSKLPLKIVHVGVEVRSTWLVPDHLQVDKRLDVYMPRESLRTSSFFFANVLLAPGATHEQPCRLDLSDHSPAKSLGLDIHPGIECEFRSILVIDNAGRRWRLQPGRGDPQRVPRGRKRKDEYEPREW